MNYVTQNKNKIERGFATAYANIQKRIQSGMEYLLEWGMNECLKAHDERHRNHFDMGDGYGWILYHNREEVSMRIYEGGYNIKETNIKSVETAMRAFQVQDSGWVGVIMASMQPRTYFVQRAEIGFMQTAINNLKGLSFEQIFRRA